MRILSREHILDNGNSNNIGVIKEFKEWEELRAKNKRDGLEASLRIGKEIEDEYRRKGLPSPFRDLDIDIDLTD